MAGACGSAEEAEIDGVERSSETTIVSTTTVTPPATTTIVSPVTTTAPVLDPRPDRPVTRGDGGGQSMAGRVNDDGTPVFLGDFADPFVLTVDGTFYAYATNALFTNVPVISAGSGGGEYLGESLPELPQWSEPGHVWAPGVAAVDDGYLLYYTTRHTESGRQCISVAVGTDPAGPFVDSSTEPLICDVESGGSIDASPFVDGDGTRWLLWKADGNCCGLPSVIYSQPLAADGLSVAGEPTELIRNDQGWERDVVEAPSMIEIDGRYHLFYSANRWDTEDYSVGHAVCESGTGPCDKDAEPWLESYDAASGPGGLEVIELHGRPIDLVVYHGWTDGDVGYETGQRSLYVAPIRWVDGDPVLAVEI